MSTLNVANISDDQSTLSNSVNPPDVLNNTTTVDTKYITNGCAKVWCTVDRNPDDFSFFESFGMTTVHDLGIGIYQVNFTTAFNTARYPCSGACYTTNGHFVGVAAEETLRTTIRSFDLGGPADADSSLIAQGELA